MPPVCKLMNYGKFRFEQSKREKEARKNQHVVEIKEIRMSPGIDVGDFNTKLKNAQKFIADGNRVQGLRPLPRPGDGPYRHRQGPAGPVCRSNAPKSPIWIRPAKLEGRMMSIFLSPKIRQVTLIFNDTEGATIMPKLKTHSGAKKRFNLTKTGKVKRAKAYKSHILTKKDTKRTRRSARRRLCGHHQRGRHPQDDPLQVRHETFEIGGF